MTIMAYIDRLSKKSDSWRFPVPGEGTYTYAVLLLILLLGFVIREWGITFGLPHIYHLDEHFEVYRALRLGMGDWEYSVFGGRAKSGYYYLLFAEYAIYYFFLLSTGA